MMNRYMFADRLLLFVSCLALIITMSFVAMIFIDLNDIWEEIGKYQERINNLEITKKSQQPILIDRHDSHLKPVEPKKW